MRALSGSLLSLEVVQELGACHDRAVAVRRVLERAHKKLGPASAARAVYDDIAVPLFEAVGLSIAPLIADTSAITASIESDACVTAIGWNQDLARARERALRWPGRHPRWWIGTNGTELRLVDASHAFSRRFTSVALDDAVEDEATAAVVAGLLSRCGSVTALDSLVRHSHAHRAAVAKSLQAGVREAVLELVAALTARGRRRIKSSEETLGHALTVVYRILFLLFAEARGLVPRWHPTYGTAYTIEALRPAVERGDPIRGLWSTLQAISRLAHRGCRAGTLRVTAFNGRLFSPSGAPVLEQVRLDDRRIREVLLALTTRPGRDRRTRISFADLGVEQLGAVYERVLEFTPTARRKNTGTFYTPRSITEYLVRRTLAPLVRDRAPVEILTLKVLDPAMGSGAFLVAACRYLADAYERALVAEGSCTHDGISPSDRAGFRRLVARRCLYGVDVNPVAVQLARLSLWLCTLAADRPLSFFDHHLRVGNSLVGASMDDVSRQRPGRTGTKRQALPLFDLSVFPSRVASSIALRDPLALEPDDSAEIVHGKERTVAGLDGAHAPLAAIRRLCGAWCATWFWPSGVPRISPGAWTAFAAALAGARGSLPPSVADAWLDTATQVAATRRFFHWTLEFPEVFFDASGEPLANPGFDAVIGNPPWETLRGDCGTADERRASHETGRQLTAFVRESGCYLYQGAGHANLYQAFAERMLRLTRHGGRTGLLLPGALLTDRGSLRLREALLNGWRVDSLVSFDNRDAIFPIHRGVRFVMLTASAGSATERLHARFGLHAPSALDDMPDEGRIAGALDISRTLIARFGGDGPVVPELGTELDCALLARILAHAPPLASADGWGARFGRELNASDDRQHFGATGMPVLEGKHIEPFRIMVPADAKRIDSGAASQKLKGRPFDTPRLGYREVASATNRLTLIAAMIPAGCVTTHTIFCARPGVPLRIQWFLCGVFNSFIANYLVRRRASTHVPASTIHQLPVPTAHDDLVATIAALARSLSSSDDERVAIDLQCAVSALYDLSPAELDHVLAGFALVPRSFRDAVSEGFRSRRDTV
jgi:hypothetical protein